MKVLLSFMLACFALALCKLTAQNNGQLVVFVQDGRSISQDFKRNALPEIKKIAKRNKLELKMVDASEGAPEEVAYTPAIFYRSGKTNTFFNGRYSNFEDLDDFVSSAGQKQPLPIDQIRPSQLMVWRVGRATLKTTMNINPLSGKPPKRRKFNAHKFEKEALNALVKGMDLFRETSLHPISTKSFHMEFYPTVKEGVLLVQMELFSVCDMTSPVFKTEIPSGSEWKDWQVAFEKAGNRLEKALVAQISNWDNGDGFDTLKTTTPVQSWTASLAFE